MTCREMEARLAALIDGALSDEEKGRAEEHLRSCGACRNALADLKRSDDLVKRLEEVEPPPWLKTRVMARVREEAQGRESVLRKLFFPLYVKIPIQAVATVLVAVVAWNVYKSAEPEFRQTAPPPAAVQEVRKAEAPPVPAPSGETETRRESPATREKKAFAPPLPPVEDLAGRKAETVREEARTDAARPPEPPGPAAVPAKDEEAMKGAAATRPQEADRAARALVPERKQKAWKAPVGTVAKEAAKREAAPSAAPMLSTAVSSKPDLDITIRSGDPVSAAAEVETLLKKSDAQSVSRRTGEGQVTVTARIRPENLDVLREKLTAIGPIRENAHAAPRPGAPLTIRIEIRHE